MHDGEGRSRHVLDLRQEDRAQQGPARPVWDLCDWRGIGAVHLSPHLKYLRTVLRHKWFVFLAGRKLGVPLWRLLVHDRTKFTRAEWGPYVRRFAGGRGGMMDKSGDAEEWRRAWEHHWQHNTHHWEYWSKTGEIPIPAVHVAEMLADWCGAGRAYTGSWDVNPWYAKHRDKIMLHPETRKLVESLIPIAMDALRS